MKISERIDNITRIPDEYRHAVCTAPKSVKIELTARCNLQCFFCATRLKLRKKDDIDFDFYKRITLEMREAGVEELGVFYLGESFLYPFLIDAIYHASERCKYPYIFLTTNGTLSTKDVVTDCMRAGLNSLKFSVNASDATQFKEITGCNGYTKIIQNIKDAWYAREELKRKYGTHCGLYASSVVYDDVQKEKMQPIIDEIKPFLDEFYFLPLYSQAGFTHGAKGKVTVSGNVGRLDAMREPIPCWAIFTEGHITYDGKLSACCFDHDGRFDMGDLNTTPFMDCWNSTKFQALRTEHLKGNVYGTVCEQCVVYK